MANRLSRSRNAKRNILFGVVNKIVTLLLPFIIRTVILRVLSSEYLGLTSLFTSILQVLNITELGFSSAVVCSMYKPIAEDDKETLCAILKFYRKMYFFIGIIILIIGLCLIPFLPKLIKGTYPDSVNIFILYIIYLLNSVISYLLFAYKNSLLSAYQRHDVISNINSIVHIFTYGIQIFVLILTKNFYLYAIVLTISTVLISFSTEICSKKLFPDILCKGVLNKDIKKEILIKVKGLMINKLCQTSRNAFDSIFVSAFLGLTQTAIYNNYYYIMNAVIGLLGIISPSILASVGNSVVIETQQKNYEDMKKINFVYMWLAGWCTTCLLCLYQSFTILVFSEKMLFPMPVVILFCVYFYILKMGDIRCVYSDAKGLWWENRYRAIIESFMNLLLNYFLGRYFGVYGIIIATIVSLFFINFLWGSTIVYKYYFTEIKIFDYYFDNLKYALVTSISCLITYFSCSFINDNTWICFILKIVLCVFIPNIIFFAFYFWTKQFKVTKQWLISKFKI